MEPDWLKTARKEGRVLTDQKAKMPDLFEGHGVVEDQPGEQSFVLPYPPTVNHYWVSFVMPVKGGGNRVAMAVGPAGLEFRRDVEAAFTKQKGVTFKGPLLFSGVFCPPDRRARDLDNLLKAVIDSLKRREDLAFPGAYLDDKQIQQINIRFGGVIKGGKSVVTITQLR